MTEPIEKFLKELQSRGVEIVSNEGRLRIDAPVGLLTEADRERLTARKKDILRYFQSSTDHTGSAQPGDLIRWVSPLFGPGGPALVLARSGAWMFVSKPSHPNAVPIVHDTWDVRGNLSS